MQIQEENQKGKILTNITVINRVDQFFAETGYKPKEAIRSITLENVLVERSVTTLCLPADTIAFLGLEVLREVDVASPRGIEKSRIFQDATISVCGREGTFDCLELPKGKNALLGRIPLDALGLELDLRNQRLKVLPISPTETYLTI